MKMTDDKQKNLVEAAKLRAKANEEKEAEEATKREKASGQVEPVPEEDKKVIEQKKAAAEEKASTRVQAMAGTMTGEIDVEAMGDVKGDGRDAKDYPDNDPAKALGVPVYEHGLGATGPDVTPARPETRISERTKAEMERGKKVRLERYPNHSNTKAKDAKDKENSK